MGITNQPSILLSAKEVAIQLGLSERTVVKYLRTKKIKGRKMPGGKVWRVDQKDVPRP